MTKTSVLLVLVGLLLAPATIAAIGAASSPRSLALDVSDFPARVKVNRIGPSSGPGGSVYSASFNFEVGGREEEEVTDKVWVIPPGAKSPTPGLVGGPKATYGSEVGQIVGFPAERSLSLARYGDQQTANWASYSNSDGAHRARAALVVRKGDVVWTLTIENCGVLAPFGCFSGAAPPRIAEAQAVAELKKYAARQRSRVGNG